MQAVQAITNINPVNSDQQDILRWIPSKNGQCSTKNIYRHLSSQSVIQLPDQGSRSIQPQANQILQRAWKRKELIPLIKTFSWRLIRRALATAESTAKYSTNIDKHCACRAMEDDAHLFFHCHLPRAVYFSSNSPLRTDNLPQRGRWCPSNPAGCHFQLYPWRCIPQNSNHFVVFMEGKKMTLAFRDNIRTPGRYIML